MNAHISQNILAETELRQLAATHQQMISPASNAPIHGIFQDSMLGSYLLTREDLSFTPRQAMNLLMMFPHVDTQKLFDKNPERISNFDLLSQIMPPLTLKYKTGLYDNEPTPNHELEIRNGHYIRGQIDKGVMGSGSKGILQRVCNDFGNDACADFIDNLQNIVNEYMKTCSYSVGISDLIADKKVQDEIVKIIQKQKEEVQVITDRVHLGIFENNTANTNSAEFENQVNTILNTASEKAGKVGRNNLDPNNRFVTMVKCGSKGTTHNISQMISCLGQQNVDGKRIPYGFDSRTLPHFTKFDDSPGARGFIDNSYINGLTAPQLFFHAMAGRVGLIDTACKTSSTGYIQRRLIKGLEDLKVEYDMTVRNSKGKIIQFAYGDDNTDTIRIENQTLPLGGMSLENIYAHYDMATDDNTTRLIYTRQAATRMTKQIEETKLTCKRYIEQMVDNRDDLVRRVFKHKSENSVKCPVALNYIINNVQGQMRLGANTLVDITPLEAFQLIEENLAKLHRLTYAAPTKLFEMLYYYYLNPRELLIIKRFHRKALVVLLEQINLIYKKSIINPGEMVGVVAGQSIGEPTTQMTLNTFHNIGNTAKTNVTRGVPRIEEILRLTKNPKNPSLTIFLNPEDEQDQEKSTHYTHMLEHTKLVDVIKMVQICFDPDDRNTTIGADKLWLAQFYKFEEMVKACNGGAAAAAAAEAAKSKWVIRLEMDPESMLDKNITMDDVHYAILSYFPDMACAYTDYNADNLVFRIRMAAFKPKQKQKRVAVALDQTDELYVLNNFQENVLSNIVLRGIQGIHKVIPRKLQGYTVYEDGKYTVKDKWVLDTTGSNLLEVLALDYVDSARTYSNDISEVHNIMGIEATRQMILNEMQEVIEFSGSYVNSHHLQLLADRMTITKNLVPIFRSGILYDDIGPIAKATFEVHTEEFLNAARHGCLDHMRGISANVMTGQHGYYGTSAFQVVVDMKALQSIDTAPARDDAIMDGMVQDFNRIELDNCAMDNIEITNNVNYIKDNVDYGGATCVDTDVDIGF